MPYKDRADYRRWQRRNQWKRRAAKTAWARRRRPAPMTDDELAAGVVALLEQVYLDLHPEQRATRRAYLDEVLHRESTATSA